MRLIVFGILIFCFQVATYPPPETPKPLWWGLLYIVMVFCFVVGIPMAWEDRQTRLHEEEKKLAKEKKFVSETQSCATCGKRCALNAKSCPECGHVFG